MKKKLLPMLLALIIICLSCPVYAAPENEPDQIIMRPNLTYLWGGSNSLRIGASTASMAASVDAYAGVTQVRITTYLQQKINNNWVVISNWSQLFNGTSGVWSRTYGVTSGYSYRLLSYFYAYINGSIVESTSMPSNIVYY